MTLDLNQFEAHGALPEDLAHEIFEIVRTVVLTYADHEEASNMEIHRSIDESSREIQTAVANHLASIQWKMLNRRKPSK